MTLLIKSRPYLPNVLKFYAELLALLEITPWSGNSYNRQVPDAGMRTHAFGAP